MNMKPLFFLIKFIYLPKLNKKTTTTTPFISIGLFEMYNQSYVFILSHRSAASIFAMSLSLYVSELKKKQTKKTEMTRKIKLFQ